MNWGPSERGERASQPGNTDTAGSAETADVENSSTRPLSLRAWGAPFSGSVVQ